MVFFTLKILKGVNKKTFFQYFIYFSCIEIIAYTNNEKLNTTNISHIWIKKGIFYLSQLKYFYL